MDSLFAYGTLLEQKIQMEVFGRLLAGISTRLSGSEKSTVTIDDVEYPSLTKSNNAFIDGVVFRVTEEELMRADEYEGEEYRRIECVLENGITAWVYLS